MKLSKKLFVAIAILFAAIQVNAQGGFKLGIKAGANLNKLDGASFEDKFSFGYHVGAFASIKLSTKFSIQPEVLFNQINVDTASTFRSVYAFNNIDKVKLGQISIPVLLSYNPNKIVSLQAGPMYSINTKRELTILQNGQQAFKSGDFSMLAGVQINLSGFNVYGRYNIGLSNLNDIDNREKWKSQSIQLGIGMKL